MKFRVTSMTYSDEGSLIGPPMLKLEAWLNAALGDADFGSDLDIVTIMFLSYYVDDTGRHDMSAKPSRMGTAKDWTTDQRLKYLMLHVSVQDTAVIEAGCRRRSKSEPPCRPNIEPGVEADFDLVGCG